MTLNYKEFQEFLVDANHDQFKNASYDLSIGTIMDMNGHEHKDYYSIPSQGMIVVVSKEKVKIPNYILGYATVKTSLSQKGIMANNIGLIDPGYEGLLSSVLINFGKNPFQISRGESFLRLSFHKFNRLNGDENIPLGFEVPIDNYALLRKKEISRYMGDNFMNYQNWVVRVKEEVIAKLELDKQNKTSRNSYIAAVAGILIGIFALVDSYYSRKEVVLKENNIEFLQKTYREELQELRNSVSGHNSAYIELNELYRKNVEELKTLREELSRKKRGQN